jgi:hypothetical protein
MYFRLQIFPLDKLDKYEYNLIPAGQSGNAQFWGNNYT